jgi:hypothetical protein
MKARCLNRNSPHFHNYGGRGITIAESWLTFENFYRDMGEPAPGMTLERRDNDGPYSPENCRWATRAEQAINKRTNVFIEYQGLRLVIEEWGRRLGVRPRMLRKRLNAGWSVEDAFTTPSSRPAKNA